jgi:hypothetical protein
MNFTIEFDLSAPPEQPAEPATLRTSSPIGEQQPPQKKKKKKKTKKERELERLEREKEKKQKEEDLYSTEPLAIPFAPETVVTPVEVLAQSSADDEEVDTSGDWSANVEEDEEEFKIAEEKPVPFQPAHSDEMTAEDLFFRTVDDGEDFECLPALQPVQVVDGYVEPQASTQVQEFVQPLEPTFDAFGEFSAPVPLKPVHVEEPMEEEEEGEEADAKGELALADLTSTCQPAVPPSEFQVLQPLQAVDEELMPPMAPSEDELHYEPLNGAVTAEAVSVKTSVKSLDLKLS